MKIETAIKLIQNQSKFCNLEFLDMISDIEMWGRASYSAAIIEAVRTVREKADHVFA